MNELLIALLTGSFTILGVGLTLWFENRRSILEHQRWYAEHFLGDKLKILKELHVALVDCYFTMNYYGNCPPQTLAEFKEKVAPKEETYLQKKVMASIYFSNSEDKCFSNAMGAFRQASMAIWLHLPDDQLPVSKLSYSAPIRELNWENLTREYDLAIALLKNKLAPESLAKTEKSE